MDKKELTRRDFIKYGFRGMAVAGLGKGFYNTTGGQVELVQQRIKIENLPPFLQGIKIGFLTDLHSSFIVNSGLIESAARLVMTEHPDLIVLTGDFISGSTKFLSGVCRRVQ